MANLRTPILAPLDERNNNIVTFYPEFPPEQYIDPTTFPATFPAAVPAPAAPNPAPNPANTHNSGDDDDDDDDDDEDDDDDDDDDDEDDYDYDGGATSDWYFPPLSYTAPGDAAAILLLLQRGLRLPPELAHEILDLAEIWRVRRAHTARHCTAYARGGEVARRESALRVAVRCEPRQLRRVVWRIMGRDQGWSSNNPAHHGSFRESHSWYEATLVAADGGVLHEPVMVNNNIHASPTTRLYQNCWDLGHPDAEVRGWMGAVRKDCVIGLAVCAQWPGWQACLEGAEIWVFSAW